MHKNHANKKETAVENMEHITKNYAYERPAVQIALFTLWRMHNKQYQTGVQILYDELERATKTSKTAYKEVLAFLEGAGMVVNEVVVESKVPQSLVQRYGILKGEWQKGRIQSASGEASPERKSEEKGTCFFSGSNSLSNLQEERERTGRFSNHSFFAMFGEKCLLSDVFPFILLDKPVFINESWTIKHAYKACGVKASKPWGNYWKRE